MERLSGIISSEPTMASSSAVTFLLRLDNGQDLSCVSGAGTKFAISDFVKGQRINLIGERKADLILGRTPFIVFSEVVE